MPFLNELRKMTAFRSRASSSAATSSIAAPTTSRSASRSPGGDGVWNRTSYLLNSQLTHLTRRYGRWSLLRFVSNSIGTSNFICYVERNADGLAAAGCDPKQDDFDIWLGTVNFQPWIAYDRHERGANYLFLDGHVSLLKWDAAVPICFRTAWCSRWTAAIRFKRAAHEVFVAARPLTSCAAPFVTLDGMGNFCGSMNDRAMPAALRTSARGRSDSPRALAERPWLVRGTYPTIGRAAADVESSSFRASDQRGNDLGRFLLSLRQQAHRL